MATRYPSDLEPIEQADYQHALTLAETALLWAGSQIWATSVLNGRRKLLMFFKGKHDAVVAACKRHGVTSEMIIVPGKATQICF